MSESESINRRGHDRFTLAPMYTRVAVQRVKDLQLTSLEGHAYDVSESGVRIELDTALDPGERVALQLGLPGESRDISTSAQVVWRNEAADDPGPRRMALQFREFKSTIDQDRLLRYIGSGDCHRVA